MTSTTVAEQPSVALAAEPEPEVASSPALLWRRLGVLIRWALPVVALALVARSMAVGWDEITRSMAVFRGSGAMLLLLALVVEGIWVFTLSQVYRVSLQAFGGKATIGQSMVVSMGAFTLSRVVPGGGAVGALVAGREFVRIGNPGPVTMVALVTAGWVSLTSLTVLVSVGLAAGIVWGSLPVGLLAVPLLILTALIAAGLGMRSVLRSQSVRERMLRAMSRLTSRWSPDMTPGELASAFESRVDHQRASLARAVGWSAAGWLLDGLALWLAFAAFGQILGVGELALGYGVANLIQALPEVTPGWLGIVEASLAATYAGLGVPAGVSAMVILGYRVVSFWVPVLAGSPFAVRVLRSHRDLVGRE